ncbi:MAG: phospholipase D-like domain-containing protein [Xenococcaceae cyanobacterium MO_167.B52]|nr:phospholipase D-like domain-containing protein [Xenococcaceae cyanobacterium MO_167.B52]
MYPYLTCFLLLFFVLVSGCQKDPAQDYNLPQDSDIQVFLNHRNTAEKQYTDSYRKIQRPGDNLEAVIIEAINSAEVSIDIAVQEFQLSEIALALSKKKQQGVKIRIIIDNNYSRSWSDYTQQEIEGLPARERDRYKQYFQLIDLNQDGNLSKQEIANRDALVILKNANIPLIDDTADGSKGSGLMHHKFIIVDRKEIITGSANFTLSGIHGDFSNPKTKGNVNNLLKINNAELAQLFTEEFDYMWGDGVAGSQNSKFGLDKTWRSPQTISWNNTTVTVQFSPTSKKKDWQLSTNGLIGKTLDNGIASINLALFVFSEQKLADILQEESEEGVKIKALIDKDFVFRDYSEGLDMLGVALSKNCKDEANNNPWKNPIETVGIADLPPGDKMHHKFATVNHDIVITGSHNWSNTANRNNDETLLIIQNETVAKHFLQEFDRLYRSARVGVPKYLNNKIIKQKKQCS